MPKEKTLFTEPAILQKIEPRELTAEMQESYLDYAMSVIVQRALPDVRDGLKPVHRRILYAMHDLGLKHNAKFRKSATVVGEVLGKYHPHGDTAVYESMVRMAQEFSMRYPLINGQGNFGSIDGDSAAAMRYTEAKLAAISDEMLSDIDKDTVDFVDNYDKSRKEPQVMPSRLPNLLLNGTMGIAVGMATNIPPHNLIEAVDAISYLFDHPDATIDDLMNFIKGPDFPGGAIIYDAKAIKAAYQSGKGGIVARAKAEIVEAKKGRWRIIVNELPYQVNKAELLIKIADMVKNKKIEGIRDLRDESDKDGIRMIIELKSDADPKRVLNSLFKLTDLQKTFHMNMLALVGGLEPRVLNLKAILLQYIDHQIIVVTRRTKFLLRRAEERLHILLGLSKALKYIDEVIKTIKKAKTKEIAHDDLMKNFKLSSIQATAILEMRLQTLAGLERKKIEDELEQKKKEIADYKDILAHPERIIKIISGELAAIKARYGDDRRTKIIKGALGEFSDEDLIPDDENVMLMTHQGYIKRMNPDVYHIQKRGGKGVIGAVTKEEDVVENVLRINAHDNLLFFTNRGKVFQTKAFEIPEASRISKGQAIVNFLQLGADEKVTSTMVNKKIPDSSGENYIVMATKEGMIKKVSLSDFDNVRRSGIIAIKIKGGDELKWARITSGKDEIIMVTAQGQSIRFKETKIRPTGRAAGGVMGIRIKKGDFIRAMDVLSGQKANAPSTSLRADENRKLLIVMENGFGKTTDLKEYKVQGRGGSGIKTAKVTSKTGMIVHGAVIDEETKKKDLLVISQKGQIIRLEISAVPDLGRATQGVRIMRLNEEDKIASAAIL